MFGSGKSNSIAWLAHRLASLHDDEDNKVYDGVIVLTDRKVLDRQLQDTIYQFEHKEGVVVKVDVTDNQQVSKGDLLFEIDPSAYRVAVENARVAVRQAQQEVARFVTVAPDG